MADGVRRAAISGVGMSKLGRRTNREGIGHLVDAALEAIDDAGLDKADIDGLATYPGPMDTSPGMSPAGCAELRDALGLSTNWHSASSEGPAQMSPIMIAAMAVATGQARHVLCFRVLTESSSQTPQRRASVASGNGARVSSGFFPWLLPFNALSAANWTAMLAQRHMHIYGTTRTQLGLQAVSQRSNALLNPRALMRDPLSLDDYLAARMISTPLGLFDCDIPIDGAAAIIISSIDAARDLRKPPLRIEAMGSALHGRDSWDQRADLTTMASHDAARHMWSRTDLKPDDVDVFALYDGFSIYVLLWLEALGVVKPGEAGPLIEAGHTRIGGRYPVNTGGGQLSAGRLHGFGLLHEACLQLWGEGGERQVSGAQVAVCGMGGGPMAGSLLLTRT